MKIGRPKKYTMEEEKKIVEDRKKMTELKTAIKWGCTPGTIRNVVKRNKNG